MRRRTRRLTLVMLATLAVAAPGVSSALAACPDLDVVCRADEAVGAGGELLVDTIGPIDTPVDEVVDAVIGTVGGVVDDVLGRANDLPGGGQVNPPDLGGGGGHHVVGPPPGDPVRGTLNPAASRHRDAVARGPRLSGPTGSSAGDPNARAVPPDRRAGDRFRAALG
ncbi:MAG: hypothetical protein M3M93_00565, partial [Actinomycetota bacterium]|nr:hypothetical protein [Actinomycetota bacterium]